jgi:hypothetical protein
MKMGSVDLIVCLESSGSIPYCQVGRDEQVNFDQPEELTEQMRLSKGLMNSEMGLDQHVQLTKEEDQDNILMIGGIGVFLPFSQVDESQLTMTVRKEEELEKTLEAAQADEEDEHSEEWLNDFSQEAKEAVALKMTEKEAEEDDEHSEEWLNIFSQETEKTATWEVAEAKEEEADNICFVDLWG